jgi:Tfp pilus assembly protein PilX
MQQGQTGSVLLVVVFVVTLISVMVMGMLEVNTEEVQLMQNHVYGAQAQAVAEAGLNDALAEMRADANWNTGFASKPFDGGSYTVVVKGSTVVSTGVTSQGYVAKVEADVTVSPDGPPHVVAIDALRVNR